MSSRLARLPAGRRTKWLVLIAWLVLLMAGGALGGKLQGVTKNNADAYLPGSAEATRVIKLQDKVHQDDSMHAVVSSAARSAAPPRSTWTPSAPPYTTTRRSSRSSSAWCC